MASTRRPSGVTDQLTPAQKSKLAAELAELEGPKRAEMVEAISVARAHGDLSENFEYHAAKNEQALLERKITLLRAQLDHAEVVETPTEAIIGVGSHVVVEDEDGEKLDVEISSVGGSGTASTSSPLGAALIGKRVGDTVQVKAPAGVWAAKVVEIQTV
jgi:transcription elongation factor GreA